MIKLSPISIQLDHFGELIKANQLYDHFNLTSNIAFSEGDNLADKDGFSMF